MIHFAGDPLMRDPQQTEGTLVATLTNNTKEVNYWQQMLIQRIENEAGAVLREKESYRLSTQVELGSSFTALYTGHLPAGTYQLLQIESSTGNMNYWVTFNNQDARFYVKPGQVTDLGRLIVTDVPGNKVVLGRSHTVTSNQEYLQYAEPGLKKKIDGKPVLTWNAPLVERDKQIEGLAKYYSSSHFSPYSTMDGLILVGSRMGSVWMNYKKNDDKWSMIDTGTLDSIFSMAMLKTKTLVVGGELGYLARFDSQNKRFIRIDRNNLPKGNIVFLKGHGENGLIVCVSQGGRLMFFRSEDINNPDWQAFGEAEGKFDFWSLFQGSFAKALAVQDHIVIATSPATLHVYYPETDQWVQRKLPKTPSAFAVNFEKRLALYSRGQGSYYSDDLGITWNKVPTHPDDGPVLFADPKMAITISQPGPFSKKKTELKLTRDLGENWEIVKEDFQARDEMYISANGGSILLLNAYWLDEYKTDGKTYIGERRGHVPDQ